MFGGVFCRTTGLDCLGQCGEPLGACGIKFGVVKRRFIRRDFAFDAFDFGGQAVKVALVLVA